MSLCPTINISPYNIVGDGENISLKMNPTTVSDLKEMYGIDIENKKLLSHLKQFGSIKIMASAARSLLNNCQTEAELDLEDEMELKAAKEKLIPSNATETIETLPEINMPKETKISEAKGGYYPYSYDIVSGWIDSARSYVCDVENGMNSKKTNKALLRQTLQLLDLLESAFNDSKNVLNSPEFRINA